LRSRRRLRMRMVTRSDDEAKEDEAEEENDEVEEEDRPPTKKCRTQAGDETEMWQFLQKNLPPSFPSTWM
jgi:hypothetical protein